MRLKRLARWSSALAVPAILALGAIPGAQAAAMRHHAMKHAMKHHHRHHAMRRHPAMKHASK
jgi:hypothetical protein